MRVPNVNGIGLSKTVGDFSKTVLLQKKSLITQPPPTLLPRGNPLGCGVAALGQVGGTLLHFAAGIVGLFSAVVGAISSKAAEFIDGISRKIGSWGDAAIEAGGFGEQITNSVLYNGAYREPGVEPVQPQTAGPQGIAAPYDATSFASAAIGDNISVSCSAILKANAPVVRQFNTDAAPVSAFSMQKHSELKADGTYDLQDSATNDASWTRQETSVLYADAAKIDDHTIALVYTRFYPNSYQPNGNSLNLPGTPEHEGDEERSTYYYDLKEGKIVGASVAQHGLGEDVRYGADRIEFVNGHPVVCVALGSHASALSGGFVRVDTKTSRDVHKWTGQWMYDRYPTASEVRRGTARDLQFKAAQILVAGVDTTGTMTFAERDRWVGGIDGTRRRASSTFHVPI